MKIVPCQLFAVLMALVISFSFVSCASAQGVPSTREVIPGGSPPHTDEGERLIVIDVSAQMLFLLEGKNTLLETPCGTGSGLTKDLETHKGFYKIKSKEGADRKSHLYKGAPMPYAMQLDDTNMFIHGSYDFKPLRAGEVDIGIPQSHGCIRIPVETAKKLSELVKIGTPVEIIGSSKEFVAESDIVNRLYQKLPDGSYQLKILGDKPSVEDIRAAREAFFNRQILVKGAGGKNPMVGMPFFTLGSMVSLSKFESIVLTDEEKREGRHLAGGFK